MSHLTQMCRAGGPELRLGRGRHRGRASRSSAASTRRRCETIGNFWVDLTRVTVRDPPAARRSSLAVVLVSAGASSRTSPGSPDAPPSRARRRSIPGGPDRAARRRSRSWARTAAAPLNANSAHPLREPRRPFTNLLEMLRAARDPVRPHLRLRAARGATQRQGWACFAAMVVLWVGSRGARSSASRSHGNPLLEALEARVRPNMRGQGGAVRPASLRHLRRGTTGTSTGAVDARTTASRRSAARCRSSNMMLGEVSPGRRRRRASTGCSIFALLAVFIAGLMVGRTARVPRQEDPGGRDEARRRSTSSIVPTLVLALAAVSVVADGPRRLDPEPRRRTASPRSSTRSRPAANNNGSAFGGLTGNTDWYNTTLGARDAGGPLPARSSSCSRSPASLARKQPVPGHAGHVPDRHAAVRRACSSASS